MSDTGGPRWAPLVYGRTLEADVWWRAVPAGLDPADWAQAAVTASTYGGDLAEPRLVFAHRDGWVLVGVACMAAALDESMSRHGNRPLPCFVGWMAGPDRDARTRRRPLDAADMPAYAEFAAHWREWAAPVYTSWVGPDWERPRAALGGPHRSEPAPAPWPAERDKSTRELLAGTNLRLLPYDPALIYVDGTRSEEPYWTYAMLTAADGRRRFALITGWSFTPDVADDPLRGASHLCCADAAGLARRSRGRAATGPAAATRPAGGDRADHQGSAGRPSAKQGSAGYPPGQQGSAAYGAGRQPEHLADQRDRQPPNRSGGMADFLRQTRDAVGDVASAMGGLLGVTGPGEPPPGPPPGQAAPGYRPSGGHQPDEHHQTGRNQPENGPGPDRHDRPGTAAAPPPPRPAAPTPSPILEGRKEIDPDDEGGLDDQALGGLFGE